MLDVPATVFVVDDDPDSRDSLVYLLTTVGLPNRAFSSAAEFLAAIDVHQTGCLVCDVRMPEMSGLDLLERLTADGFILPVIFITAFADVPMAVRALKSGAVEFVEKPFEAKGMLARIRNALQQDRLRRIEITHWNEIEQRVASLTDKERETLVLVRDGAPNKAIAAKIHITERAVEMRRAALMKKMQVHSLAELIRIVTEHEINSELRATPFCRMPCPLQLPDQNRNVDIR
jgi:FixJ family two-component response regulator